MEPIFYRVCNFVQRGPPSIEETFRETSHSMSSNETLLKVDASENPPASPDNDHRFSIAEREKMKWAHPVELANNPYAKENLEKRMRDRENTPLPLLSK